MPNYHVFCDESYTGGHAFRVQGGVWLNHKGVGIAREEFAKLRHLHPKSNEFKWSKVHGRIPYASYADLVSVFFDGPAAQYLSFKCLVVNSRDDGSHSGNKEEKDLGFYKAYHLLLKHRCEPGSRYRIRLDRRSGPRREAEIQVGDALKANFSQWNPPAELRSCEGICSKTDEIMQLADVLCGAVGWAWNGKKAASPAKAALAEQITSYLPGRNLTQATAGRAVKFNVWHYSPNRK